MQLFVPLAIFSILLFALVIMKRTYIAQLLGPGIPEPFDGIVHPEKMEDLMVWMSPY